MLLVAVGAAAGLWWLWAQDEEDNKKRGVRGLGDAPRERELEKFMRGMTDAKRPYEANAAKHLRSGRYNTALAPKLWFYYVEKGVAAYNREHGTGSMKLSRNEKMALAQQYARAWEDEHGVKR
jgi:hypothetical protein